MPPLSVCDLSLGSSHSVALLRREGSTTGSLVVSFGRGEDGQLGHGHSRELDRPAAVASLADKDISAVHCGAEYTIALSTSGLEVYSWGWGDFGRLGHGDGNDVSVPRPIAYFQGLEVGRHSAGDDGKHADNKILTLIKY